MMGTDIDLKPSQQKGTEINFNKRFYRLNKCREIGKSKLVLLSSVSFKTNFSTQDNIGKSGNLVDQ